MAVERKSQTQFLTIYYGENATINQLMRSPDLSNLVQGSSFERCPQKRGLHMGIQPLQKLN